MNESELKADRQTRRVAILGGGISGLAAALRIEELAPQYTVDLFESTHRLGGILETVRENGYLVERAADNFLRGPTAPWAEQLSERRGVADQLIPTDERHRGAHVGWQGELLPVPTGFQLLAPSQFSSILRSRLLTPLGKLRLLLEPLIREPRDGQEETLRQFATRRLGREAFERLVEPLVAGIYTADPDRLSVEAALPQMVQMARESGSLYRAMRRRAKLSRQAGTDRGARYSLFVAPREGMSAWVNALASRLERTSIHFQCSVERVHRSADGATEDKTTTADETAHRGQWQVDYNELDRTGLHPRQARYDAIIVALPAHRAAEIIRHERPLLAASIDRIPLASSTVVCFGFREDQIRRPLNAFGCVIPALEHRPILAISYSSVKFPGRAPMGSRLLRVFIGGALQPELADLPDDELTRIARDELSHWLHVAGRPQTSWIVRWPRAMPQYELGHTQLVTTIEKQVAELPQMAIAGNYLRGVGVPQCVHSGELAAERIVQSYLT